jgi:hypothetical protein
MNIYSVLQNFNKNKHYFKEPYPHIIIEHCLPLKTYELLYENFPVQTIKDNFKLLEGHTYRGLANDFIRSKKVEAKQFWLDFFEYHTSQDFYDEVLNIFEDTRWIKSEKVKVRHTEGNTKIVTDTQFVIHEPIKSGTTRTSHIDNPLEIYAGLLYMRQRGDKAKGGDFVIYDTPEINSVVEKTGRQIPKSAGELIENKAIRYKENTFVMFLNSNKAVHGVTPRVDSGHDRLSINIIAEVEKRLGPLFKLNEIVE